MNKRNIGMVVRLILILLCFTMALLSFLGVGTMDEPNGKLMFGLLWICVGILSIVRYLMVRRQTPAPDEDDRYFPR